MVQKIYYKTKDYCKVKFSFKPEAEDTATNSVEIVGLSNDWQNPIIMKKRKDGVFTAELTLPKESRHEFKYLVNEALWVNEPDADNQAPNDFGGTNSVIQL